MICREAKAWQIVQAKGDNDMQKKLSGLIYLLVILLVLAGCGAPAQNIAAAPEAEALLMLDEYAADPQQGYPSEKPQAGGYQVLNGGEMTALAADLDINTPKAQTPGAAAVTPAQAATAARYQQAAEIRGVWISYLEMDRLLKGKTAEEFRSNIAQVFSKMKEYGLNTAIVQVRPFGDALYQSAYFPWSYTITGTEGTNPGFDPLQIMVQEARKKDLRIEAWINPYRVRAAGNSVALAANNPARIWQEAGDSAVIRYNGALTYNPASTKAQNLIVNGVRELVRNYDIDGIHIDDYFYPATSGTLPAEYDQQSYNAYKKAGGTMELAAWRRANVELLLKKIYAAVKEENPHALFGVSPQSSVYNNYYVQHLDVKKITSTAGYCDYVCPQIYFGFANGTQPFAKTLDEWNAMAEKSTVELYVGLAAYKVGLADSWAGNGSAEWKERSDMLAAMVKYARGDSSVRGFILYRYDSIFQPATAVASAVEAEKANLKKLL